MLTRIGIAAVLSCFLLAPATAQTVRFDTNVGNFDMQLNPTGNANLQGHVNNILNYVEAGRYDLTVINRAAPGFVMQMGGFNIENQQLPASFNDFPAVTKFDPVIVDSNNDGAVDFDVSSLLNTRGTVSLALSNNANTGTSSFFVNLGSNTSLDAANLRFVPFATVNDMTTIDLIMGFQQANLAEGGLAGDNVPLVANNQLVYVERAFVLPTASTEETMAMLAGEGETLTASVDAFDAVSSAAVQPLSVPEPPALVLALGALVLIYVMKPGNR